MAFTQHLTSENGGPEHRQLRKAYQFFHQRVAAHNSDDLQLKDGDTETLKDTKQLKPVSAMVTELQELHATQSCEVKKCEHLAPRTEHHIYSAQLRAVGWGRMQFRTVSKFLCMTNH